MASYVIFGAGRVGVSMASYLEHLGHKVSLISREQAEQHKPECEQLIAEADIIAAAVPDDKLDAWRETWRAKIGSKTTIHFSGAVSIDGMHSFHPLYSFPRLALPVTKMKEIAFACPVGGPSFSDIFPQAPNPYFEISAEDRARYHALAVLSGNLASFIWNETANEFAALTNTPPDKILQSYLGSIVDRFIESPMSSLTGPVDRRDRRTVGKNLDGLAASPKLKGLYQAFLDAAWPDYDEDKNAGKSK
ncbi:MAG: DUF2520 domain-containing protein [Pseudomonadota bacterium]